MKGLPHFFQDDDQPEEDEEDEKEAEEAEEGDEIDKAFAEFNAQFPNKKDVKAFVKELFRATKGKSHIRCKHCGSDEVTFLKGGRVLVCDQCGKDTWITADTFFKGVKHVRAWVAAIWFLERGLAVSSLRFSELLEIAFSTAWNIFKKLSLVIQSQMDSQAIFVDSSYFRKALSKRSRLTAGRKRPFEEETDIKQSNRKWAPGNSTRPNKRTNMKKAPQPSIAPPEDLSPLEKEIFDLLSENPTRIEEIQKRTRKTAREVISAISMLEILGLAAKVDNGYAKADNSYAEVDNSYAEVPVAESNEDANELRADDFQEVNSFIDFIHGNFHGISRKYLQLFLAKYWCIRDRARWHLDSLLLECHRFRFINDKEIPAYESPLVVKLKL